MSADLNTTIAIRGTSEELLSMLKVLKIFETEKREQYRATRDCGYIEWVNVSGPSGEHRIERMTDDEMTAFVSNVGTELNVTASGPWGAFFQPGEVGLFEALANAAPKAYFNGNINGFVTGADVSHNAELKDGKLYLSDYLVNDEDFPDLYIAYVKKKLSHSKFCKLFKVDKEDFDSYCYDDFLMEAESFPTEMGFEEFMECCDCSEIDEDQYETAIEKVLALGLVDFYTFRESIDQNDYTEKRVYDPETKRYRKGTGGTNCDGLMFVVTGKVTEFKNRTMLSEYIESQGGSVTGSVSKNTDYLINNDPSSDSSKNKKAVELGVKIISEAEFIAKFGRP